MAGGLPPPPTKAASGDFAWIDWYNKLNDQLNKTGSIDWSVVNKAGSSIADIQDKRHNLLTSIQGGTTNEYYHLTAAQYASIGIGAHNSLSSIQGGNVTERYHFTNSEHTALQNLIGNTVTTTFFTKSSDPTTTDITSGKFAVYKNTTSGLLKLWGNDGGTLKSVTLT